MRRFNIRVEKTRTLYVWETVVAKNRKDAEKIGKKLARKRPEAQWTQDVDSDVRVAEVEDITRAPNGEEA